MSWTGELSEGLCSRAKMWAGINIENDDGCIGRTVNGHIEAEKPSRPSCTGLARLWKYDGKSRRNTITRIRTANVSAKTRSTKKLMIRLTQTF